MVTKWLAAAAIDPGMTSGYVQGVVPLRGSTPHKVKRMKLRHAEQVLAPPPCNGGSRELMAALELFHRIDDFATEVEAKELPLVIVIEDFNLRGHVDSLERELLSPVRITEALAALLWRRAEPGMEWLLMPWLIQPSVAITTITNDRLKRWGLWERGMPHARDAWRHFATFIRSGQDGGWVRNLGEYKGATDLKRFRASGRY